MADSLKSLTQLAFIFTPLNFGASIFGANIREFGNGIVPAWAFVVSIVALGSTTILVSWVWSKKRASYGSSLKAILLNARSIVKFARRSPFLAGLIFLIVLFHQDPTRAGETLDLLRLKALLQKSKEDDSWYKCHLESFKPALNGIPFREALFQNSIYQVARYTSELGWQNDRFYKPWLRWRRNAEAGRIERGESEAVESKAV